MKRKVIIIGIIILLFLSGIYFINYREKLVRALENDNKEKVVQALQNYNKLDEDTNNDKDKKLVFNDKNILENIKGIWGNGVICSYKLYSKPTDDTIKKYSNLAKKNIIISNRRYFNIFDSISYNKVFKNPSYKVSKVNDSLIDYDDNKSYIIKSSLDGLDTEGAIYKITVNTKNLECKPVFYTNGNVLRVDYNDCSFIYTKLN